MLQREATTALAGRMAGRAVQAAQRMTAWQGYATRTRSWARKSAASSQSGTSSRPLLVALRTDSRHSAAHSDRSLSTPHSEELIHRIGHEGTHFRMPRRSNFQIARQCLPHSRNPLGHPKFGMILKQGKIWFHPHPHTCRISLTSHFIIHIS